MFILLFAYQKENHNIFFTFYICCLLLIHILLTLSKNLTDHSQKSEGVKHVSGSVLYFPSFFIQIFTAPTPPSFPMSKTYIKYIMKIYSIILTNKMMKVKRLLELGEITKHILTCLSSSGI